MVLFLLVFYRVLGVIASVAMGIYGLYLYAIVELIPIVLTLPGIAGMILTLGVAADANIVIFERVKEEIRAGRSVGAAISAGYKKGLTAILDANIVTILVAFILFVLATSGVRGFALTLGVGVIVSLFTAVLATQAILYALRGTRLLRSRAALGARDSKPIRFDFIGGSRWFFSMSGLILLICALAIAIQGLNFGIDFEGGTRITAPLERAATVDQVRDTLAPLGLGEAEIQTVDNRELGRNVVQINAEELGQNEVDRVEDTLRERFGFADDPSSQSIGASFGQTVAENAIRAIIASLIIISLYITLRFQWKFAVPVLIALSHDLLITSGVYALTGREVTASTVAALLTILGFSLYDTIVVFDRVRENIPRMPNAAFSQIYNRSMSEVIVRSLATSFCATLPILALLLFGGETLQDFAFALLVGTISGTYSSVFIAGPVLTHWKEREPVYQARETRIRAEFGAVPAYAGAPVGVTVRTRSRAPPREAALMAALVWVMMGIALWHFAIFVPDHFWSGIVGAFVGAVIGALLFGFLVHGLTVPGQNDTDLINALEAIPGAIAGMAVVYFIGLRDAAAGRSMPVRVCAMRWRDGRRKRGFPRAAAPGRPDRMRAGPGTQLSRARPARRSHESTSARAERASSPRTASPVAMRAPLQDCA